MRHFNDRPAARRKADSADGYAMSGHLQRLSEFTPGPVDDQLIEEVIRDCDGNPRAALVSLIRIVRVLLAELRIVSGTAKPPPAKPGDE